MAGMSVKADEGGPDHGQNDQADDQDDEDHPSDVRNSFAVQFAGYHFIIIACCTIELSTGVTPESVPVTLKTDVPESVSVGAEVVVVVVVTAPSRVPPIVNSQVAF